MHSLVSVASRRRRPRIEVVLPVESLDGGPPLVAQNLGLGGMLVTTSQPRWPGQHIRVRFTLPGEERAIRATCRVVELVEVPRGIGLSLTFLALAPSAKLAVLRFISGELQKRRAAARQMAAARP